MKFFKRNLKVWPFCLRTCLPFNFCCPALNRASLAAAGRRCYNKATAAPRPGTQERQEHPMASTYMNIGGHIAALRKARGLTQEQLAAQLGVSAPAVSKWETNVSLR